MLAFLCLILATVLFFRLDIRGVLGYLTGRQRRKSVKALEESAALGGCLLRENDALVQAAQKPGKVSDSDQVSKRKTGKAGTDAEALPGSGQRTELLCGVQGAPRREACDSTEVLADGLAAAHGRFTIEREIIFIHTEEVI